MTLAQYNMDSIGGQSTWTTDPSLTLNNLNDMGKILDFEPISDEKSVLYTSVNLNNLDMSDIVVHPDCPPEVLKYIQYRVEYTVPVMNWIYPNDPCWKHLGKTPDGYAKHNPKRFKYLPEEARNCSTQLSRFIYRWVYQPEGISRRYDVDHKCGRGTNGCINPRHLQLLTPEINKALGNRDYLKGERND
tara:strand:+ start:2146 stop:2712 length:567 start_codon:yes stop_codon:yes gene_type:complete